MRRTLLSALRRLDELADWERLRRDVMKVDAAPCTDLCSLLAVGPAQRRFRCVHVAGSKGKGTVSTLVSAALQRAGWRTGVFTSPHVETLNERLRIGGRLIDDARLGAALHAAADAREAAAKRGSAGAHATWFDALVAGSLFAMNEAKTDWAVVECGLGGRHDSTGDLGAELCVLTSVELEHTEVLGSSLSAIATEKAGIVSRGASLVAAVAGEAADAVASVARERHVRTLVRLTPSDEPLGPDGNLATARAALDELGSRGVRCAPRADDDDSPPLSDEQRSRRLGGWLLDCAQTRAVAASHLPCRQESVTSVCGVPVLLDGAHTPASVGALVAAVCGASPPAAASSGQRPVLIFGLMGGKEAAAISEALAPLRPTAALCTAAASTDGGGGGGGAQAEPLPADVLAAALATAGIEHASAWDGSIDGALGEGLRLASASGTWLLVIGSFRLCGEARRLLLPEPS